MGMDAVRFFDKIHVFYLLSLTLLYLYITFLRFSCQAPPFPSPRNMSEAISLFSSYYFTVKIL